MLSSIGKEGATPPPALPVRGFQNTKRKAEEEIAPPSHKANKTSALNGPDPAQSAVARQTGDDGKIPLKTASTVKAVPYRGTSKPTTISTSSSASPIEPSKQHKKGSYKEIMARAQAAAGSAKPPVGTISHKPKDRMEMSYKKELKMKKKAIRDKKLGKVQDVGRPSSPHGNGNSQQLGKTGRNPPQAADSGAAKPKTPRPQPSYKGTMNPSAVPRKSDKPKHSANQYAATDDELDEDDAEDGVDEEYGYSDEESDDMEAGFSDVEQEESAAAKAARKEDEEEARLEARLRREKEERKRRLEAIAKKAKPQRY